MHDPRARRLTAAGLWLALALCAACRGPQPATAHPPEMARDQLFFAARKPEPVLLALVLQRTRDATGPGATLEAKAFLVARDRLQSLFWERVALDAWPGDDLRDVLAAWQRQRKGPGLRLSYSVEATRLTLGVRQPGGGFVLDAEDLQQAVETKDPHGRALLRSGSGSLEVNGQRWQGPVLAERLAPGSRAWPHFGRFEMWLAGLGDGALWLGRCDLQTGVGQAAVITAGSQARLQPFTVQPAETRRDAQTGFALPTAWTVHLDENRRLLRRDGQTGRGQAPGGGAALYDISVASEPHATALIFHLQDE